MPDGPAPASIPPGCIIGPPINFLVRPPCFLPMLAFADAAASALRMSRMSSGIFGGIGAPLRPLRISSAVTYLPPGPVTLRVLISPAYGSLTGAPPRVLCLVRFISPPSHFLARPPRFNGASMFNGSRTPLPRFKGSLIISGDPNGSRTDAVPPSKPPPPFLARPPFLNAPMCLPAPSRSALAAFTLRLIRLFAEREASPVLRAGRSARALASTPFTLPPDL